MSNSLMIPAHALLPTESAFKTMLAMSDSLFKSGILPEYIKSSHAAFAIIQKGIEVGVPPMAAIAGISFVKGKATMGAELMHACIIRDHGSAALYVRESTDDHCTVAYNRPGLPGKMEFTFTIEMAKAAGLTGSGRNGEPSMYTKYPAAMLRSRAISYVAKMAFPDSIGGMLTSEEMGASVTVDADGVVIESTPEPIQTARVTREAPRSELPPPSRLPVTRTAAADLKATSWELKGLWATAKENAWDEDAIRAYIGEYYPNAVGLDGRPSMRELTSAQVKELTHVFIHDDNARMNAAIDAKIVDDVQPAEDFDEVPVEA